jgi:hypothetical protein
MSDWESKQQEAEHMSSLQEWRIDKQKRKENCEAAESMLTKYIVEALKNPNTKKNLGGEGLRSMKAGQRGEDPVRDAIKSDERFGGVVTEHDFTGINEERPWERS